ncbi:MAG TPA: DNA polymerase III subunit alpha, partial [candidate division Zixibacteria bacterium]|nr:DNA polymerase III subunit alpha [candidate division Zixibacteria bacterium]
MNALYRPGPLDAKMIDVYIECKHGKKEIEYVHPILEEILKDTYGVIVFQEQVLKIARELGGYTLGEADILRKAMGKKQADVMAEQKGKFIEGAAGRKIDKKTAEKIFDQIETFGRYGFVKAHSACYAYVAYQTAYLKVHYPVEFMAALMSSEMSDTSRILELRNECERMAIQIRPPDINHGLGYFSVEKNQILFALTAVKNVGGGAVETIVAARKEGGPYTDLFDFASRVDLRLVNKRTFEGMVMSGAMDSLGSNRAELLAGVEAAVAYGSNLQKDRDSGQSTLFGGPEQISLAKPKLPKKDPWTEMEVLAHEKDSLGYWISGHPLDPYREIYDCFVDLKLSELENVSDGRKVAVAGVLTKVKIQASRAGKPFGVLALEDFTGAGEIIVFSDVLEKRRLIIKEGNTVIIFGYTSVREGEKPKIKGDDLTLLDKATSEFPVSLKIIIDGNPGKELNEALTREFEANSGASEIVIEYGANGKRVVFKVTKFKVDPNPKLLKTLKGLPGVGSVKLQRVRNNGR